MTLTDLRDTAFSARARLLAFEQLLRHGVNVYLPLAGADGVDGVLRREDGRYLDLIVRPSANEHAPLRFMAAPFSPSEQLFVVCVAWALSPLQVWIIPSNEFTARAERLPDGWLNLDLDAMDGDSGRKHKISLGHLRNAWRLLVDGAVKSLVAY